MKMANIAIVTSTSFGGSNKACFLAGLSSSVGNEPPNTNLKLFESNGNYDKVDLRELVRSAVDDDPRPDLIVAAEGLEIAEAAASELRQQDDPHFIFLSGDVLDASPVRLAGGVNFNAPIEDGYRKALLKQKYPDVQEESIYLVVNDNSLMRHNEARSWPRERVMRFFEGVYNPPKITQTTDQDNKFIAEFSKLAQRNPRPSGLVISVDPYFRHFRTAFTMALAELLPVPVCYPFQAFVDASSRTTNKHNSVALNRPPLNNSQNENDEAAAYFQLGKQVGRFLAGVADVGVVTWNGSEWKPEPVQSGGAPPPNGGPVRHVDETSAMEMVIEAFKIRVKGRVDEAVLQELLVALRGTR